MYSRIALSFQSFLTLAIVGSQAIAILLGTLAPGHADGEHKRVMIFHSVGREFRPSMSTPRTFERNLIGRHGGRLMCRNTHWSRRDRVTQGPRNYSLNTSRHCTWARRPDLIVSVGAPSAAFFQRHRKDLFPTTPIVFTVLEDRRVQYANLTENDTVVSARNDFRFLFESYLGIAPDTKIIAVINGNSPNEQFSRGNCYGS